MKRGAPKIAPSPASAASCSWGKLSSSPQPRVTRGGSIRKMVPPPVWRAEIVAPYAIPASDSAADYPAPFPEENFVSKDNTELRPEVQRKLDEIWDELQAVKEPTAEQINAFLNRLLALPPEATSWSDLFHEFARHRQADLPGVFRRIAAVVPHTVDTDMG